MNTKKLINRFAIVLDASGSMLGIARPTVDAFNATCAAIRDGSKSEGQTSTVTYLTFSERHSDVNVKFQDSNVDLLTTVGYSDYYPAGSGTALWDAVGKTIETLEALPFSDSKDVANVVFIITDGDENASRQYTAATLKELIHSVEATNHWTLAFLLPRGASAAFCRKFGISEGNVREWDQTVRGVQEAQKSMSLGVASFLRGRTKGVTSTRGFFVTDLSKVSATQLKKTLDDIRDNVTTMAVDKKMTIKDFVEKKTRGDLRQGQWLLSADQGRDDSALQADSPDGEGQERSLRWIRRPADSGAAR
jgi:hypothetical protein